MLGATFSRFVSDEIVDGVFRREISVLSFRFNDVLGSRNYPSIIHHRGEVLIRISDSGWWEWVRTLWFEGELYCIHEVATYVDDVRILYVLDIDDGQGGPPDVQRSGDREECTD